ncbi:glycosyltransferase family 4 protein [Lactiplantibacillus plantarum]|uniref:glycosyltransferase family 4 protein n=1 Tax=Lactiplantibacillus plantarum TaxID=1590 RepID=UPI001B34173B|nr:glycosyltransferase family 4 protein [Lactiplantibacillus plantarum]MBP5840468.1 glycosyltransferase family 4 protein [Lactiplantibacillus plantarum]
MKLVVLTKQFGNYTGATISTIELLKRISSNFDSVLVLTLKTDGTIIDNVNVTVLNGYLKLIKSLKKQKNVIGYSDDHLGFLFSLANINYVHTYHGNWPDARKLSFDMFIKSFYFMPLYKITIREAWKVISVSQYMQQHFVNLINKNNEVIYNGVRQKEIFEKKSDQNMNNYFIMVGNIDKRKYSRALKIFDELEKQGYKGTIDIYGAELDQLLVKKLDEYKFVNVKGIENSINYGKYNGLICTSASENLPVSIIEAIINRIPVISSNVGGIPEVVNYESGILLDVNDVNSFATTIINYEEKKISRQFADKVKATFNWDQSSDLYMQVFKKIGKNK